MAIKTVELPKGESIGLFANRCIKNIPVGDTLVITFFAGRTNRVRARQYHRNSLYKDWSMRKVSVDISLKISMIEGELSIKRLG